jgi:hypothetical protein
MAKSKFLPFPFLDEKVDHDRHYMQSVGVALCRMRVNNTQTTKNYIITRQPKFFFTALIASQRYFKKNVRYI